MSEPVRYEGDTRPMSVQDWFLTMLILAIPFVNLVMLLVWAFGSTGNVNRRNFCRASLLWFVISIAIMFLFLILAAIVGGFRMSAIG